MNKLLKLAAILAMVFTVSCASLGAETPRQKAAVGVAVVVGVPFLLPSYLLSLPLQGVAYITAQIWGPPAEGENVAIWYSSDFGPNYASVNIPPCWTYAGTEPEDRALAEDMAAGTHIRQIELGSLEYEVPPTFTVCRTNVGIRFNKRGDESFPLQETE